MTAAVALVGVEFGYDRKRDPVLSGVTVRAGAGESVAILGANGAGKTTLTRLVVALEHPWAGEVAVMGRSTKGRSPSDLATSVAYVFQHPARQFFARSVLEEVAYAPQALGKTRAAALDAASAALVLVGLADTTAVHPHDLPSGAQKLVALAAAVAQDPAVLILDEPTQGLDLAGLLRVAGVVRELRERGVTVLAVTHDMTFVAEAFDRLWLVGERTVAADERVSDLFVHPDRRQALGLRLPPVPDLAVRMGWGADRYRIEAASAAVATLGGGRS